mmetsp:Transcript_24396/g.51125  ORF Transcript_24396/g.51125 Transcript_24396/m.51125 type:complete len:85 (-) Transcript_24396:90-344(-)
MEDEFAVEEDIQKHDDNAENKNTKEQGLAQTKTINHIDPPPEGGGGGARRRTQTSSTRVMSQVKKIYFCASPYDTGRDADEFYD